MTTNAAVVAWRAPSTGYTLQTSSSLTATIWLSVASATKIVGSENQVIISPTPENRYFRLKNP